MRYGAVMKGVTDILEADAALTAVIPAAAMFMAGEREFTVPSLEWTLVSDVELEVENPLVVQFDLFTRSMGDLETAETRVRFLLTQPIEVTWNSVRLRSEFAGGNRLAGASKGVYARSFDFRFTPVRARYLLT